MIVTDGDKWEMYEVFKQTELEEKLLMKLELSQQSAHKNALQALAMRKPNLTSKKPVFKPPKPPRKKTQVQPPIAPPKDPDNWCSFEQELYPQYTKPEKLKIGDNPEETITNWKAAIHKIVVWLADEKILSANDCPIGTKVYTFIGPEEVNPDGTQFKTPQTLSNGLILQCGYVNTIAQWQKLRQLLGDLNVNRSTIRVSYRSSRQVNR